ncbi:MAG: hypothetical protein GY768_16835 [Planctomycetaceae bacterium]|nr:hypothetical protein [Planctomycetaceae bacterium]
MGFLSKLFGATTNCPDCGVSGAKDSLFGVKCENQFCRSYDEVFAKQRLPSVATKSSKPVFDGPVVEFTNSIEVQYINFRGDEQTFTADRDSIETRKAHLSMAVAPTGKRITLNPEKIVNRSEVENLMK